VSGSQKGYGSALERLARDLCVLTDWYTERPAGLTFRELGERYGMSESGAHHLITNTRGRGNLAHLLWPVMAQRLMGHRQDFGGIESPSNFIEKVSGMLDERVCWSQCLMAFADDRRELERLRAGAA